MKGALEEKLTSTMSDFVIDVIDNVLKHPRNLVKVFCRDGAEVNELAIKKLLKAEFRDERNKVILWPVILMTDDSNSYNSNFLKHMWW